ncbi:MAG: YnbE family lipoprotein [Desulfamplus sp.]|nr:YnbE family lipoprotein [Desulfamplus sp.]MBF0379111.1 YnbE family lipoprotein [Desulfamplus sp.]MBF0573484.1 YnbE family lipoprotein [Desulfamplus sp.]
MGKRKCVFLTEFILIAFVVFIISGCNTTHEVQVAPLEVKPIHITIDINVKVDKALENYFDDIDKAEEKIIKK